MAAEHVEMQDAIAAALLGSAAADERQRVVAHLRACAGCRELAGRLGRVTAALPLLAEPVDPPARLRGRILAAVEASGARAPERAPRPIPIPIPVRRPRFRLPRLHLGMAAAAGLAFALVLGVAAGVGQARLLGPAATVSHLTGTGSMAGVQATARIERDGLALVDFRRLPPPPAGHVYELWLLGADGAAAPAGVFVPDVDGSKVVVLTRHPGGAREIAVTVEPGPDGSPAPTRAPELRGGIAGG